jgi:hypothetical protein
MKLIYSRKIFILAITFFAGVLALNIIFANLLFNKIVNINNKVKQLNISSQERERELNLRDSIADSKAERERLEQYFVGAGNAETVKFTKYLEDLALEMGVTQSKTLNYEPVIGLESSSVVSTIRFKFSISGKWANVYNFQKAIENLPKVVTLNSVSLSLSTNEETDKDIKSTGKIWNADLDFSVINLKQ